ncbi:MAG: hypothetical protein RIC07_13460 [Coleofasciculus sp. E1-EBD-02]
MQDIETLHREAMELVDQAVLARQRGDAKAMREFYRAAFAKERAAADLVANQLDLEPTRSVLHRSAAVLALECGELQEAERLIGRALAGNPPDDIVTAAAKWACDTASAMVNVVLDRIPPSFSQDNEQINLYESRFQPIEAQEQHILDEDRRSREAAVAQANKIWTHLQETYGEFPDSVELLHQDR